MGATYLDDPVAYPELQPNTRLVGPNDIGDGIGRPTIDERPEMDEAWDAADFENMFLAWQPAELRTVTNPNVYSRPLPTLMNCIGNLVATSFPVFTARR